MGERAMVNSNVASTRVFGINLRTLFRFLYELQKAPLPASEQPNSINATNTTENVESKKDQ